MTHLVLMGLVHGRKRVLRWGNGYGIRLTKADMERLGIHEKQEVDVTLEPAAGRIDLSDFPFLRLGGDARARHDELAAEAAHADL